MPLMYIILIFLFSNCHTLFIFQCVKAVLYDSKMSQSNIDEKNDFGETPLHIAAKWGFRECFVFTFYEKILYNVYPRAQGNTRRPFHYDRELLRQNNH